MSSITAPGRVDGVTRWKRWTALGPQVPLAVGFVLLVGLAVGSVWLFISNQQVADRVGRTLQMRSKGFQLLSLVQDAETGQRGYLLTGDRYYLQPYAKGVATAPAILAELRKLAASSPTQTATLLRIEALMKGKFAELETTVALTDKGDAEGAREIVRNNKGNKYMARIREEIGQFESEEERSLTTQTEKAKASDQALEVASLLAVALIIVLAAFTIATARRSTRNLLSAQDRLRHTNENLEGLVAERVAELQAANEEIQRFAYIVSHDLRAPLVNVMGFTSELDAVREDIATFLSETEKVAPQLVTSDRRAAIDTDLPEALGFIRSSTAKMDRLINAILKLSREGRRVLTPQKIDVGDLVKTQGESLSTQLAGRQATLEVQPDLPDITSDRLAVEQIFGNLIDNAVKYLSPERPGRVAVTGRAQGIYIRYDIADNGRGIEAKDYERVFELFRRSGVQDTQGEGIGLAYVRNLARRLGGNVTVKSEFGAGSTFTVMLPETFTTKAKTR